jgi:hypothetical protein
MRALRSTTRALVLAIAAAIAVFAAKPAFAVLSATATITTPQTSAPFNYTVNLHNTGTTDIGTFWFAWTATPANYDFLPTMPTNVVAPSGWIAPITHNGFPGDGYGIEWYNYTGSNIAAGQSQNFTFTSNDTPATIAGNAWFPGNKVSTSFVYIGFPQTDPGLKFDVQVVPEPMGALVSAAVAGFALLSKRRCPSR